MLLLGLMKRRLKPLTQKDLKRHREKRFNDYWKAEYAKKQRLNQLQEIRDQAEWAKPVKRRKGRLVIWNGNTPVLQREVRLEDDSMRPPPWRPPAWMLDPSDCFPVYWMEMAFVTDSADKLLFLKHNLGIYGIKVENSLRQWKFFSLNENGNLYKFLCMEFLQFIGASDRLNYQTYSLNAELIPAYYNSTNHVSGSVEVSLGPATCVWRDQWRDQHMPGWRTRPQYFDTEL